MPPKIEILYEDNHLIIINKSGGSLVQGDQTGDRPLSESVKLFLKDKYKKPGNVFIGVVHRLDRPVSGCLIFAKTSKALARMNSQFRLKKMGKTYWALTAKRPPKFEGRLIHFLTKDVSRNISKALPYQRKGVDSKKAVLDYSLMAQIDNLHLLEIHPRTGRSHQIRAQMAAIGCPIFSDIKYGSLKRPSERSIYLHAYSIRFTHPTSKETIEIFAPLPKDPVWNKFAHFVDFESPNL